ncbi:MAG: hypothetical protein KC917_00495 [Candidatus Omnitrophica bacterium]|nr:hypothetical protein [Candidatus Omnitrophota bacterium]
MRIALCLFASLFFLSSVSHGSISLSLDNSGGSLFSGDTTSFTVFLNVDGSTPDPTVPPNSIPTPMSAFNFSVALASGDGGALQFISAVNAPSFTTGSTTSFTASQAIFGWSGSSFTLGTQQALGTFTVQGAANGTIDISLQETMAGNDPGAGTADFVFQNSSQPFGGDDQLFTVDLGGGSFGTGTLATINAVPEPSACLLSLVAAVPLLWRRRV